METETSIFHWQSFNILLLGVCIFALFLLIRYLYKKNFGK
jgi:hypothetical protein